MSTLYRTAYYVDIRSIPTWYEQKRPRTYLIGDDSFRRSTRRSFSPLQKPPRNLQHFMCEQKPHPIWFRTSTYTPGDIYEQQIHLKVL